MTPYKWIVSQIGAREHYAIPRSMERNRSLRRLYTDIWCRMDPSILKHGPARCQSLAGRYSPEIQNNKVTSFSLQSCWERIKSRPETIEEQYRWFMSTGVAFAQRIIRHLRYQTLSPDKDAFIGYNTGCLEVLHYLREHGIFTVVDQVDPARTEEDIVLTERDTWPEWEPNLGRNPEEYYERLYQEWQIANVVMVNSQWSKTALIKQGVSDDKIIVVPLAYEPTNIKYYSKKISRKPLKVLWLGSVNLRKGIPYLLEAARLLLDTDINFRIVGSINISEAIVKQAPANVVFTGPCPRIQAECEFINADIFVLPTLSDGFAITQIEAMNYGLPVITTAHCGQVVTNEIDGYIVMARNSIDIANKITKLNDDRNLLCEMSANAFSKAKMFNIDNVYRNITTEISRFLP